MITLGAKVKCSVTGFSGTATKRLEILHGSTQIYVEGHDCGFRRDEWIEERRLREESVQPVAEVRTLTVRPRPEGT